MFADLWIRILTAAVLIPVSIYCVWQGGGAMQLFASVLGVGLLIECARLIDRSVPVLGVALVAAYLLFLIWMPLSGQAMLGGYLAACLVLAAVAFQRRAPGIALLIGFAYCGGFVLALLVVRGHTTLGLVTVGFIFAIVWCTDIIAYFVGRMIGGPKLWPAVSPSKTWSGAVGGLLAAMLVSTAFLNLVAGEKIWLVLILAAFISAASQAGDLLESTLKRRAGVKDAGKILPGHGGFFDRTDGLISATWGLFLVSILIYGSGFRPGPLGETLFLALR